MFLSYCMVNAGSIGRTCGTYGKKVEKFDSQPCLASWQMLGTHLVASNCL